ncbi:hypothetical protein BKA70DRAFT_1233514 [Coprinopsis sp. MPI-PUGE-AT-0042]|nr:hypothetical protein BKA70DRAFT_1233514 [Coprinopsis sp. MPI-PUGE-AT-0042]
MVKASQSHLTSAQRRNKDQNNARRRTLYHEKKEKYVSCCREVDVLNAFTNREAMEEACSEQQTLQSFRSRADEPDVKRHEKAVHASHSVKDVKEQEAVMNSLCAGNPRTWVDTICRNFIMRQRTEPGVAREILKSHVSKFKRILAVVVREEAALVQHAGTPKATRLCSWCCGERASAGGMA